MKKIMLALGLTAGGAGIGALVFPKEFTQACMPTDKDLPCVKFIKTIDGDTYKFNIPTVHPLLGKEISVRLSGIDTPESKGKECEQILSFKATTLAYLMLDNAHKIDLKSISRDKYFRILADVYVDDEPLAKMLMDAGLAVEYHGEGKTYDWCGPNKNKLP